MSDIDLVIPYVDSNDYNWQLLFNKYNPNKYREIEGINARNRFRGQGDFFKYWFRSVNLNMPWIRKIHLVVQSESQVPSWINKKEVHIVYHEDIIPEEYLPTFNSTCIEMFLWKIEGLSEKFIYANDDFYAIRPLKEEYFFDKDRIKNNSLGIRNPHSMYQNHCLNGYCLARGEERKPDIVPAFSHMMRPYLRSNMEKSFKKNENKILKSITRFRDESNINIYYFDHCLIRDNLQMPRVEIKNRVISSKMDYKSINIILEDRYCNMIAIQDDNPDINLYENYTLNNWFRNRYSFKSKYEE